MGPGSSHTLDVSATRGSRALARHAASLAGSDHGLSSRFERVSSKYSLKPSATGLKPSLRYRR